MESFGDGPSDSATARHRWLPPAWSLAAVGLALFAAGFVLLRAMGSDGGGLFADETYYVDYVAFIAKRGPSGFTQLFESYLADEQHWQFPNPLRMGFIACGAWVSLAFEDPFVALRYLSAASHLATVVAAWLFARRLLGELDSVLVAWCVAFSTLLTFLAQRAITESFTVLWMMLAIWGFFEVVKRPGKVRVALALLAWFGALLAKETSILLLLPLATYAVHLRLRSRVEPMLARAAFVLAVPPLVVGVLQAWAAGGPGNLLGLARIILESPAANDYARMYGSGPWYQYAVDFLALSPWIAILGAAGAACVLLGEARGEPSADRRYLIVVLGGLWLAFAWFTKNVRYVAVLDVPLRILSVLGLREIVRPRDPRLAIALRCAIVLVLCFADWRSLHEVFLDRPLNDPTTTWILGGRRIVPLAE